MFGFTQTLVKRLLAVPSFSFCCCHTALFTCMLLQLPRCSMGLLLSASKTNCCWDSDSVGACCVDRGLCLVLLPLQLLLICLVPGTQQQGSQAAHQLPSPPCVSTILYIIFFSHLLVPIKCTPRIASRSMEANLRKQKVQSWLRGSGA